MKIFALIVSLVSLSLPCQNRPWEENYGEGCKTYKLIVVGVQQGSGGWNEIHPSTYTKIVVTKEMLELRGIWGKVGDTLSVTKKFIDENCAKGYKNCDVGND